MIKKSYRAPLICLLLALATILVYWPVTRHEFVNYDDEDYVTKNPHVTSGLSVRSLKWAFTEYWSSNWHPLTWVSHIIDCQLYGIKPSGHHLTSLLLHAANTVLLFLVLRRMTNALGPSAFVAALFALHPLHVESVAWVAERKDVLSTFFFLLALGAYARYAQARTSQPSPAHAASRAKATNPPPVRFNRVAALWYALAFIMFACGLMSKPMLVTLPFVLLLLDYWPFGRFPRSPGVAEFLRRLGVLALEKTPFFLLTLVSSVVTARVQKMAMPSLDFLPLSDRVGNALISYVRYLGKTFWPSKLAVFYPHPGSWPSWQVAVAAVLLAVLTAAVLLNARRRPFLPVGWFWFLGTLVPVIGLVQVGSQSIANRYTYVPLIGVFIMIACGIAGLFQSPQATRWKATLSVVVLCLCALGTSRAIGHWQNSETLFKHDIAVTENNITACFGLGKNCADQGRMEEAIWYLEQALRIKPEFPDVEGQLAHILAGQGKFAEAIERYRRALSQNPKLAEALNNLAWLLATHPNPEYRDGPEAVRLAERACEATKYQRAIYVGTLAAAYAEALRFEDAIRTGERARQLALRWGETNLAARNLELIELYRSGKPFRETYK